MADQNIFLQREARLFVQANAASDTQTEATRVYEIPILEGFSFSQSSNVSEITISEASTDGFTSRRGRMAYTDSLAPAEFSFSTYARPFKTAGSNSDGNAERNGNLMFHDPSEILWAMMVDDHSVTGDVTIPGSSQSHIMKGIQFGVHETSVNFQDTDFLQLAAHNMFFQFGGDNAVSSGSPATFYKLKDAVINECTINFDIDGIATYEWSGFASGITEMQQIADVAAGPFDSDGSVTPVISEGLHSTNNLIMNRLSTLNITEVLDANTNYVDAGYDFALTGGSITISNNIEYVVPASLNSVSLPLAHYTGTRSVSGSFTCYLNGASNGSADFLEDIIESSKFDVTNMFKLTANIGGTPNFAASPTKPVVQVILPAAHIEIPVINVEEVLSVEVSFHGLPNNGSITFDSNGASSIAAPTAHEITGGNEIQIAWEGITPDDDTVSSDLTV